MLRAERGISRKALAEAVGVHYQTIGYIERAEYSPSLDLVLRIAAYVDLPVESIFSLEPFPPLDAAALRHHVRRSPSASLSFNAINPKRSNTL